MDGAGNGALLDPDRLFPTEPRRGRSRARSTPGCATCRSSARTAIPTRAGSPRTRRFPIRRSCSSCPTTTSSACCYSQGVPLEDLGVPRADGGPTETDGRTIWRRFAENYHLLRGTPSRLWLDHAFETVFGLDERLSAETADAIYDHIADCLARPEFRPRALFERFGIEVIATTESPLDDLRWHRPIRDSGWNGRVITAYRPDAVVDPEFAGFAANVDALRRDHRLRHRRPGTATSTRTGPGAPSSRRTARPAPTTATPPRAPRTCRRPRPRRCSRACAGGRARRPRRPTRSAARC